MIARKGQEQGARSEAAASSVLTAHYPFSLFTGIQTHIRQAKTLF